MPNLKDIRRRIKSVKNTQKITQAMKMVAAAKVKRAENRVIAARPYAKTLAGLLTTVMQRVQQSGDVVPGLEALGLGVTRPVATVGLLVISADRGLCGAYHATMVRRLTQLLKEYAQQGVQVKVYLVGQKLIQSFKRVGQPNQVLGQLAHMTAAPTIHHAQLITEQLMQAYQEGTIDRVDVLATEFISMIASNVVHVPVFPIQPAEATTQQATTGTLLIEPDPASVLRQLVPMALTNRVYQALLEASANEQASRMTAMSNATKNAGEMINKLSILYNKARQASITQEILEVVSGASALG
jgi:F-type H+-transporting ATPase subunit gamma